MTTLRLRYRYGGWKTEHRAQYTGTDLHIKTNGEAQRSDRLFGNVFRDIFHSIFFAFIVIL